MGEYHAPNSRLTNEEPASWHAKTHTALVVDVADVIVGSAIGYRLSAIGYRLSAIGYRLTRRPPPRYVRASASFERST
jgi:hypothetical protein